MATRKSGRQLEIEFISMMHYELGDLRLLLTLVRCRSLSNAAFDMHLTVSAVSLRLKNLEEQVGTKLFERTPKGLVETRACLVFAEHARKVLETTTNLESAMRPFSGSSPDPLRLQSNSCGIENFLCAFLGGWLIDHPTLQCTITQRRSSDILEALVTGEADVGIIGGAATKQGKVAMLANVERSGASTKLPKGRHVNAPRILLFTRDRYVVVIPENHPLAIEKTEPINFRDVLGTRYAALPADTPMSGAMRERAERLGFRYRPVVEAPGFLHLVELAQRAGLLAVVPRSSVACISGVVVRELVDAWADRPMAVALPPEGAARAEAEDFARFICSPQGATLLPSGMSAFDGIGR